MIKFSIIIPVYNAEKTILRCLSSVQRQSYADWEVLAVDDGSTDASLQLLEKAAAEDARIKVVHQKNGGTSKARNLGLELASGDYVLFLDNDDYWPTEYGLQEISDLLDESHADVLNFDSAFDTDWEKNHRLISNFDREKVLGKAAEEALNNMAKERKIFRAVWSKAISLSLIRKANIRFPEGKRNEDTMFTADLIINAKSYDWYNKCFYIWVKNGESQSFSRPKTRDMRDLLDIISEKINSEEKENPKFYPLYEYFAYPYIVLLGQLQATAFLGNKESKKMIKEAKKYKFLFQYDGNPEVHKIHNFSKIFGYRLASFALGYTMWKIYRQREKNLFRAKV